MGFGLQRNWTIRGWVAPSWPQSQCHQFFHVATTEKWSRTSWTGLWDCKHTGNWCAEKGSRRCCTGLGEDWEIRAKVFSNPPEPVCYRKNIVPARDRECITIPAFDACNKNSISSAISKMVTWMVWHLDQDDRYHDGAAHWHTIYPKLLRAFEEQVGRHCTHKDRIHHIHLENNKTRFECQNSRGGLVYIRAIQGHTGGITIRPELMSYVLILYDWKEFIFHRISACNQWSITTTGLVAGGKESKEGPSEDFSKRRKVHCQSHCRRDWTRLSRAQDHRSQFWKTKSNAIVVCDSVPKDCIERVVCDDGDRVLFQRVLTPRPRPKVALRSKWQISQQQQQHQQQQHQQQHQQQQQQPRSSGEWRKLLETGANKWSMQPSRKEIDLRMDGIPQEEMYSYRQYM